MEKNQKVTGNRRRKSWAAPSALTTIRDASKKSRNRKAWLALIVSIALLSGSGSSYAAGTVIGTGGSVASGDYSVAGGYQTTASGAYAVAGGYHATASGSSSTAIGNCTTASGMFSMALGIATTASGNYSTAMGRNARASGENSMALGELTTASGFGSTAMGHFTTASGFCSTAMGRNTTASGVYSTAMGYKTTAIGQYSTTMGNGSTAWSKNSLAALGGQVGDGTITYDASGNAVYTETTSAKNSAAIGNGAKALVDDTIALGSGSVADRNASTYTHSGYDPATNTYSTQTNATWKATQNALSVGDAANGITRQITGVAAGSEDTDAVNVAQLKQISAVTREAAKSDELHVQEGTYSAAANGDVTLNLVNGNDVDSGKTVVISDVASKKQQDSNTSAINTGYTFAGDTGSFSRGLPNTISVKGDGNITTSASDGTIQVKLNSDIKADSLTINNGPSLSAAGINANNTKITNVAAGENGTDAVNVNQLHSSMDQLENSVNNSVGNLGNRMNHAVAGVAALAALHPLEYDPNDKWAVAAGYGNYKDANAVALGLFYQPNENVMVSFGSSFGNAENVINAGVSFRFGSGSDTTIGKSKAEMARDIAGLRKGNAALSSTVDVLSSKVESQQKEINELKEQVGKLLSLKK